MSETDALDRALNESSLLAMRGRASRTEAPLTAAAFMPDGSACAFADGDGTLHLVERTSGQWPDAPSWRPVAVTGTRTEVAPLAETAIG